MNNTSQPPHTHDGDVIAIMRALDEAVRRGSSGSLLDAAEAVLACLKARHWKTPYAPLWIDSAMCMCEHQKDLHAFAFPFGCRVVVCRCSEFRPETP